jgi:carbonic anhydrase/acetyltransferase-like protein (isoleucine patch superfamily)
MGGIRIKKTGILLVLLLAGMLFVSGCAEKTQGKEESATPAKAESPLYMKFNMQIFTFLSVSLSLALLGGVYTSGGKREERNNAVEVTEREFSNIMDPVTPWNPKLNEPVTDPTAYNSHPQASVVIGDGTIDNIVMVSPMASIRGDERMSIFVGNESNIKDGVVLHAVETIDEEGDPVEKNLANVSGKKYAVYVGERVSLAHQSNIHYTNKTVVDVNVNLAKGNNAGNYSAYSKSVYR